MVAISNYPCSRWCSTFPILSERTSILVTRCACRTAMPVRLSRMDPPTSSLASFYRIIGSLLRAAKLPLFLVVAVFGSPVIEDRLEQFALGDSEMVVERGRRESEFVGQFIAAR